MRNSKANSADAEAGLGTETIDHKSRETYNDVDALDSGMHNAQFFV